MAMVEAVIAQEVKQRLDRPGLGIGRSIDNHRNAGLEDRPAAHDARLERHIQRTPFQPPVFQSLGGLRDGDHLGMRSGIVELLALIVSRGDDPLALDDYRADRNLVLVQGGLGLGQGEPHVMVVGHT